MATFRGLQRVSVLTALAGMLLGTGLGDVQASHLGSYCGGWGESAPGRGIDLNLTCRDLYGSSAFATAVKPDAHGWVCRVPGQADKGIDLQRACRRWNGDHAIATLIGIGPSDWRCLLPADLNKMIVPVLLFPSGKVNSSNVSFVSAARQRVTTLLSSVRHFYQDKTFVYMIGTHAYILPTATSAGDWQALAAAPDATSGDWRQSGYHKRVLEEMDKGGWLKLDARSTMIAGAFMSLGPPTIPTPQGKRPLSWFFPSEAWAMGRSGPPLPPPKPLVFSLPPSVSDAACNPATTVNPPEYERAFFHVGNRLGVIFGLPRTDQYPTYPNGPLLRPPGWEKSIMYTGDGTRSLLFPFEASELYNNWRHIQ